MVREPPADRPDRSRAVCRRRSRRARPRGQRAGARPVDGVGGTAAGAPRTPGVPDRRAPGSRPAPDGPSWSAAGPAPGPPCPGWPPPSSSMPTTPPTGRRAHPPTARSTSCIERARREDVPCFVASPVPPVALAARTGLRTVAPSRLQERAGWPALERVDRRGARPAQRHVLGGVRPPGPRRSSTMPRRAGAARWSASTTARAAPACWPAATAGSWPVAPAAAPPWPSPAARRCCAARAATRRARSSAPPAAGCA